MESQKRLLLTMAVCLGVTLVWMMMFPPKLPPQPPPEQAKVAQKAPAPAPTPAPVTAPAPAPAPAPVASNLPITQVPVDLPQVHYRFSSEGGGIASAELLGEKNREQGHVSFSEAWGRLAGKHVAPPPQMNLAQPLSGEGTPLAVSIDGAAPLAANTRYQVSQAKDAVDFHAAANGWDVSKHLSWGSRPHVLGYDVTLRNTSNEVRKGELAVHYGRAIDPKQEQKPSFLGGVGNLSDSACLVKDKVQTRGPKDKPADAYTGPINAFGISQQYFLSAVYPLGGAVDGRCVLTGTDTAREAVAYFPFTLKPGESLTRHFGVYVGPKDDTALSEISTAVVNAAHLTPEKGPQLDRFIDLGFFAFFAKILLWIMVKLHSVVPNWGLSVILLTVIVKIILTPLTHRGLVSQEAMKKVQPKVNEIRKKYAEDKERQQMEIMRLYQAEKVNPFGGCLIMLIQLPIWWALYSALRNSFALYHEPFISPLWTDLTFKDPTYLLPVLLGVTQILTMRLQPQTLDAAQAKMMTYVMPIFFTLIMVAYPLGLTLYIVTNNVLTVGQQWWLKRWMERKKPETGRVRAQGRST